MPEEVDEITAEVLLREPNEARASKVARYLQEQGVAVTGVGAASISIRCSPSTFEKVFRASPPRATPPEANPPSGSGGTYDYGSPRQGAYAVEMPVAIPEPIADDVEGVYVQSPPRYL